MRGNFFAACAGFVRRLVRRAEAPADAVGTLGSRPQAPGDEATVVPLTSAAGWPGFLAAVVLVLAAAAAYHNSFKGPFIYDDLGAIVGNPTIRHLWPIWPVLSPPSTGETVSGRPLLNLSLAINFAVGDLDVRGYHATNLAIHIAAALLLFGILRRTFLVPKLRDRFGRAATPLALASALVWMIHPLQTESVTYIAQRAESLAGFFYLLTLYCTIRGAGGTVPFFLGHQPISPTTEPSEKRNCFPGAGSNGVYSLLWYAAAVLACLLGMACKEVVVTAPLLVLLYDGMFLAGSLAEALRRRWGLYLGLAATWGLLISLVLSTGLITQQSEMGAPDPWSYACTQPGVILYYLRLSVWPHPLCMSYGWPVASRLGEILPGAMVIGLLLAVTVWGLIGRKAWAFLGAWLFVILAPTSSISPLNQLAHEHRMYLSLAAIAVLGVVGGYLLWDRLLPQPAAAVRWAAPLAVLAAVLIALGYGTVARNRDFHSLLSIWQDAVDKRPHNPGSQNNLACALIKVGRIDEAIEHFQQALRLKPDYARAHYNLGNALVGLDRTDEAIEHYHQALRWNPELADAHNKLGFALAKLFKTKEAIAQYDQALQREPDNAEARYNLANALVEAGRTDEAIEHYHAALWLNGDDAEARHKLAAALVKLGRTDEAIEEYNQLLQRLPDSIAALDDLAWLLATQQPASGGDPARAVRLAQRASELTGQNNARCLDALAAAYAAADRFPEAVLTAQRARQLAESTGDARLAKAIRARLELYRAGQPYRQSCP